MASVRRGLQLPCAGHGELQSVPVDPPQVTAETISQAGGASGKMCLRKGKMPHSGQSSEEKSVRSSPRSTQVNEEGARRGAPGTEAEILPKPVERPHRNRCPQYSLRRTPCLEQEKSVSRKERQRGTDHAYTFTTTLRISEQRDWRSWE